MKTSVQKHWQANRRLIYFMVLMVVFRSSFADWNSVPTGSMNPTILEGDRILVNKLAYDLKLPLSHVRPLSWADPQRGDIIVFDSEVEQARLVKRVIGLPGDVIAMQNNQLFINGELAQYSDQVAAGPYLRATERLAGFPHAVQVSAAGASPAGSFGPVSVPDGRFLVLGDNRDNSKDSRFIGFIARSEIIGRARHVVLSLDYDHYYLPRAGRFLQALDAPIDTVNE